MKAGAEQTNASANLSALRHQAAAQPQPMQYVDLFELAPVAYLSLDADHTIQQMNFAAAELLGAERERLQGTRFDLLVANHSRRELGDFLAQVIATGTKQTCQLDLAREHQPALAVSLTAKSVGGEGLCLVTIMDITQRRLAAERELLEAKARFRALTRMSYNFYWKTDAEHRLTQTDLVNRHTGVRTFQQGPHIGSRRWEVPYLSPDAEGWAAHRAMLDAHLPFRNFELSRLGVDGTERHITLSGDPVFDASGAFTGYHGLGRDITEGKLAEKAVRESEERYRNLFANAGDGILILSREGRLIAANETFARMHGYTVPEIMRMSLQDLVTPETFELAPQRWERIYSGELQSVEVEHRHKDGHVFTVEISASLISSGGETQMQFFYRDTTERKLAEKAVRESEERYRNLFANAGDGILIVSSDRRIVAHNESFARMHGYSMEEMANIDLKDLLTPETYKGGPHRWRRILEEKRMSLVVEHFHKDGHVFPVEITASLIHSGGEVLMQTFHRDITERKRTEAALLAAKQVADNANRAKTRFLAAASHDLRQPVQAINLFLDALAQTELSDEQREISGYLGLSVRSLRELLNTLLDISQLDAGAVKPELAAISIENLFRELETEFGHLANEKNLRLRFFACRDLSLLADPRLLQRALRNIVGNAIKYTDKGGILVGVRRRGADAEIQVWDTGIGIAAEHMGQIFEEYFQIDNQARDRNKGTGLGLAIVERLVKLIDGEIHCSSRPGRGTVFGLRLPLARKRERGDKGRVPQAVAGMDALALSRFGGKRVVVVEDDPLVLKGIEHALTTLGATVASFGNAEAALADEEAAAADLYISDFRLPGRLNGVQLLDAIQRRSAEPIKAVLMTGDTLSNQIELSASTNWKVLFKPIDLRALLSAL